MKYVLSIVLAISLFNCDNGKQLQHEVKTPTSFLTATSKQWNKNEKIISGTLSNKATKADYSNIVILVHYFSNTGYNLGTERVVDYYILKAGESRDYRADIHPPTTADSIDVTIERASYVDYNEKGKYD